MWIDYFVVQQTAVFIEAGHLAAVPEARVDGKRPLLPDRRREQQLLQILSENPDGLFVGLCLGFLDNLVADRRLQQPVEGILEGELKLLGYCSVWIALPLALYPSAAPLR